jgi:prefoldin subunit 4
MRMSLFCEHPVLSSVKEISLMVSSSYRVGEAFLHIPLTRAHKHLTRDQESLDADIAKLRDGAEDCEKTMKQLKVSLYAKFGKAINLDV